MSACSDIQARVLTLLGQPGATRVPLPLVAQRPKDLTAEILAAAALGNGLCAYVYPVLPGKITDDAPFVFVEEGDLRVRILERPSLTKGGPNAWQIADDIANFLHWQPKAAGTGLDALLEHPLQLKGYQQVADQETRLVDVVFGATYRASAGMAPVVPFTGDFDSASEGLQACCQAQLQGTLTGNVPVLILRDHDLESQVAGCGNASKIEILPPLPASALQGVPFVFFSDYQVKIRVTEYPQVNDGPDIYDLIEEVMGALHWQSFGNFLGHPLQLDQRPVDLKDNLDRREAEITFHAVLGFQPEN